MEGMGLLLPSTPHRAPDPQKQVVCLQTEVHALWAQVMQLLAENQALCELVSCLQEKNVTHQA